MNRRAFMASCLLIALLFLVMGSDAFFRQSGDDLYADLGVPRGATKKQIKKKFRTLAKEQHPDTAIKPEMTEQEAEAVKTQFAKVLRAYNILSDDEKRNLYDQQGVISGENDMQHKQHQEQYGGGGMHGGFPFGRGFRRQPPKPITSQTASISYQKFVSDILVRRGRKISLVQLYHDDCYECRVFAAPWDTFAKSGWGSVLDFIGRANIAEIDGDRILHHSDMSYPPAPLVFAVVDGKMWPLVTLESFLYPNNEDRILKELTRFVAGFYRDFGKATRAAISGSDAKSMVNWVISRRSQFGPSRTQIVLLSDGSDEQQTLLHTLAAMTKVPRTDVAIAPGGMRQLNEFVSGVCKQRLTSTSGSPNSQRDAMLIFSCADPDALTPESLCKCLQIHTSASQIATRRIANAVQESHNALTAALKEEAAKRRETFTSGRSNSKGSSATEPAADARPLPLWTAAAQKRCLDANAYCLIMVQTKGCASSDAASGGDPGTQFLTPEWASPAEAIEPFTLFAMCASSAAGDAAKAYWETLRPYAKRAQDGPMEGSLRPLNLIAVGKDEAGGEAVAVLRHVLTEKDDPVLTDFLAGFVEGAAGKFTIRRLDQARAAKLLNTIDASKQGNLAAPSRSASSRHHQHSGGNSRGSARWIRWPDDPADAVFLVEKTTLAGWYFDYVRKSLPGMEAFVTLGIMFLVYKFVNEISSSSSSQGRSNSNNNQRNERQRQRHSTPPPPPEREPRQRSTRNQPAAAAPGAAPKTDAPIDPLFGIPQFSQADNASTMTAKFLVIVFTKSKSMVDIPNTQRIPAHLTHDPKVEFRRGTERHKRWWTFLRQLGEEHLNEGTKSGVARPLLREVADGPAWFMAIRRNKRTAAIKPGGISVEDWICGLQEGTYVANTPLPAANVDGGAASP